MTAAVTDWFAASVKPVRKGWYEAKCEDGSIDDMNWWFDGHVWRSAPSGWICAYQDRLWRGLAADPAKAAK